MEIVNKINAKISKIKRSINIHMLQYIINFFIYFYIIIIIIIYDILLYQQIPINIKKTKPNVTCTPLSVLPHYFSWSTSLRNNNNAKYRNKYQITNYSITLPRVQVCGSNPVSTTELGVVIVQFVDIQLYVGNTF